MIVSRLLIHVPLALLLATTLAAAQTAPGAVRGTVTDSTGAPVPDARVTAEPVAGGGRRAATAAADGTFTFTDLAPGRWIVEATRTGFDPEALVVDVTSGNAATIVLTLAPAAVTELVSVTASGIAAPVSSIPNTVTVLDREAIDRRTAIADDLPSVLEATVPGFGPSLRKLTGRGETLRGRNPLYTVNGVPQHTPLRDGERDGHTIDLDFVDRIEVVHGANAIQGIGATGGVVNLVTKAPRSDGAWTHDVKLSFGNHDSFDDEGWSTKLSYLLGKKVGRLEFVGGVSGAKRGLFFDADGNAVGLYPTQGDIMDSSSRSLYGKVAFAFTPHRRAEVTVSDFRLSRDGDFLAVPGDREAGRLSTTVEGDPRPLVGEPAKNESTLLAFEYRDRALWGGEGALHAYIQDYEALFEGGTFPTFALTVGGPPFLDQSAITSKKMGAKVTWALPHPTFAGLQPAVGLDLARDRSAQILAATGREWVPETELNTIAPFVQLQRLVLGSVLVSGGVRLEHARITVDDFTTLPSSNSTFVSGGRPTFTEALPNIGAVVPLTKDVSVYASLSEGFTMPDVGRVLRAVNVPGQDVDSLVDIEPVVAGNIETGFDFRRGQSRVHAAYYRSVSERGSLLQRTADNIYKVTRQPTTIDGIDLVAEAPVHERVLVGGTYAWLRGSYDSDGDGDRDTDLDGINIAPNRLNVYAHAELTPRLSARVQVARLFERQFDGLAARPGHDFSGYTIADLFVGWQTAHGVLRLGVENLLDRQYVTYFSQVDPLGTNDTFFAGAGRTFTVTLERRF